MSNITQQIIFPNSGLNHDDDQRYFGLGDSPYRLNILVSDDGSNGIITNLPGNTRAVNVSENELILSHAYVVIGSYYNRLTRKVYYLVFSQPYEIEGTGLTTSTTSTTTPSFIPGLEVDYTAGDFQYDNRLLCYNEDTGILDIIFIDTRNYFGVHYNYPMRDWVMIGNWLYMNTRVSEPKVIDVEMAYNYTNYDAYDDGVEYVYGDKVTFYGGLFMANQAITFGETPSTDTDKWDRIGNSYQNETSILTLDSEFRYAFNVIKSPPKDRISYSYGSDNTIYSNNVRGRVFRFTHRYQYFDNSYSTFSAYSDITLPLNDELYNGEIANIVQDNNFIRLSLSPHSSALVKYIEIYFQEIDGDWRRCKIINRQEQAILDYTENFIYDFYNNEAYEVYADPTALLRSYDLVPKMANSQEIINENILCYGGVREGFDNIPKEDIDVILTPEIEALGVDLTSTITVRNSFPADVTYGKIPLPVPPSIIQYYYVQIAIAGWYAPGVLNVNDYYIFAFTFGGNTYSGQLQLTAPMLADDESLATAIRDAMINSGYADVAVTELNDVWIFNIGNTYPNLYISGFIRNTASATTLTKKRGFKTGAFHPLCIFYYDESLRRWDAQTSKESINTIGYSYDGTTVYIPMFNEISPLPDSTAYRWIVNWKVNHLPPTGARYWRWGYAGNSLCNSFVQYIVSEIQQGSSGWDNNMLEINIEPLQTITTTEKADWNQFPQSNIVAYPFDEFLKGDRIRFITETPVDISAPGTRLGDLVDGVYDYEIIKFDDATNLIYVQYFDPAAVNIGENTLVEIYRPLQTNEKTRYYEFGNLMPIIKDSDDNWVHCGEDSTKNQDTTTDTPATGTFRAGDIYHIYRTPSKPLCTNPGETINSAFHESMWWSDFYDSDQWDKGKPGTETLFNERVLNIIRFSNPYFQNTQINGLATFDLGPTRYKELNDVFGKIVAIYEVGDTLKFYQERKAGSILIGRTEYTDAEGNTTVAISESVLGAVRYSPSNYSTIFPESISRNNKFIYGFDVYNGVMWRDSVNGIFPISGRFAEAGMDSDYKMATYFKLKSKALLESGLDHVDVLSVWDEEYKNLYVMFKDYVNEENIETIVFHEPSNRWICFADFDQTPPWHNIIVEPSWYIEKGFSGGIGFTFDEDTRFSVFNIVTGGGGSQGIGLLELEIEVLPPTVQIDSYPPSDLLELEVELMEPSIDLSWVHADGTLFTWNHNEYGSGVGEAIVFDIPHGVATITAKPSWLTVKDETLHTLSINDTVNDGETITIYPTSANTGGDKNDSFVLQDDVGNTETITCVHFAGAVPVQVNFTVGTAEEFTIWNEYYIANIGTNQLYVSFNHDFEGTEYKFIGVTDASLNVLYTGSGNPNGILVRLAHLSSKTMTLSRNLVSGDVLTVKIGLDT